MGSYVSGCIERACTSANFQHTKDLMIVHWHQPSPCSRGPQAQLSCDAYQRLHLLAGHMQQTGMLSLRAGTVDYQLISKTRRQQQLQGCNQ